MGDVDPEMCDATIVPLAHDADFVSLKTDLSLDRDVVRTPTFIHAAWAGMGVVLSCITPYPILHPCYQTPLQSRF